MSTTAHYDAHGAHGAHDAHAHGHPTGWRRFVYSTNHKDIGTMYLVFAIIAGIIGAALSIAIRAELMFPGVQIFHETHIYDVFVTAHGQERIAAEAGDVQAAGFVAKPVRETALRNELGRVLDRVLDRVLGAARS